jgi:hypothetical protein
MAEPQSYERQYSFAQWQAQHPSDPLPGSEVDGELNAVKASVDETQAALSDIRRADGQLANASVGLDQLKPECSVGVAPAVMWVTGAAIAVNDTVFHNLLLYRCTTAHTAGVSFDSSKFVLLADLTSIVIAPGTITATALGTSAVTTAKLANSAVTPEKIGSVTGSRLVGRFSTTTGDLQYITIGSGLTLSAGGVLSAP